MKIIIVRHGETEANAKKIVQGHSNIPLSEIGIAQAKKVALRLKKERIDIAFCSDLPRARMTAEEIMKFHKAPLVATKELRERSHGIFENRHADEMKKYREERGIPRHVFRPEGGESFLDIEKRAGKFLSMIMKKYKEKNVLLVAHGGINRVLLSLLLKKPLEEAVDIEQKNTCVNIVEISDGMKIHKINCTEHL
ncbi:MAG: histidine phosphatase family protein [Candidatus Aenigmarchaeota archaeon]|nr:histidine phosphatase family protein [Candidatus Aenigmarchaeota archaeon]